MFEDIIAKLHEDDIYLSVESFTECDGTTYYALAMLRACATYQRLSPRFLNNPVVRTYVGPERLDIAYL